MARDVRAANSVLSRGRVIPSRARLAFLSLSFPSTLTLSAGSTRDVEEDMAVTVHPGVTQVSIALTLVLLIGAWRLFMKGLKGVRRSASHRMRENDANWQAARLLGCGKTDSSTADRAQQSIECSRGLTKAQRMTRWEDNIRQIKQGPTFIQRTQPTFQTKLHLESAAQDEDSITCWSFGSESSTLSGAQVCAQGDKEDFAKPREDQ